MVGDGRFEAAIAAIDAVNAADPTTVVVGDRAGPKELLHAELMTQWVSVLDPDASEAQLLAARAHHLRRWTLPRAEYPPGRAGYLRWRAELSQRHAADAAEILADVGYDSAVIARVQTIIGKKGRADDAGVQTHEDALCLVFLETQFADLASRLGDAKTIDVVAKTIAKMSGAGVAAASSIEMTEAERALVAAALER